jgi:hypothetical protein
VPAAEVLYVDGAFPAASDCTQDAPCGDLRRALELAGPGRSVLRVAAGLYLGSLQTAKTVTLIADPGTVISPAPGDTRATLLIDDAVVTLHGVTVSGQGGEEGLAAIRCAASAGAAPSRLVLFGSAVTSAPGAGIDARRCQIEIEWSTIAGNAGVALQVVSGSLDLARSEVADNAGGGLVVTSSRLLLRNSILARNGTPGGPVGGAFLGPLEDGSRVEHNTIVDNQAASGAGVTCWNQDTLVNNIIYGNAQGAQIVGCKSRYSLIGPLAEAGAGNVDQKPMFLPPDARGEFRLDPRSPGVDQGEPSDVRDDIDGDVRPQDGGFDIGADEVSR